MRIKVNGEVFETDKKVIFYADVVHYAFGPGDNRIGYSMTWAVRQNNCCCGGIIYHGQSVEVQDNMSFSVADTSNA